jgi:hypothetical protein
MIDKRRSYEFWIRFLFSTLVDFGQLDTEEFVVPIQACLHNNFAPDWNAAWTT